MFREALRPNDVRGKIIVIFIYVILGLEFLEFVTNIFYYGFLSSIIPQDRNSLLAIGISQISIGVGNTIMAIAAAIAFIMWFRRAYYNLGLRVNNLSFGDGWAAGAWFVPFLNLVRPYKMMREMHVETNHLLSKKIQGYPQNFSTPLVGWWWALFLFHNFLNNLQTRIEMSSDTIEASKTAIIFGCIAFLVGIPLTIVTTKMIKSYMIKERMLIQLPLDESEIEAVHTSEDIWK